MSTADQGYSTFARKKRVGDEEENDRIDNESAHGLLNEQPADVVKNRKAMYRNSAMALLLAICMVVGITYFSSKSSSDNSVESSSKPLSASSSQKPNFVFILADDLGYGSVNYNQVMIYLLFY